MALFSKAQRTPFSTDRDGDQPAVLGTWRDRRFDFDSPEARKAWHHAAYNQGIDPENWHLGREMDERTESVVAAGLGGSLPPIYRGPDGKMRFGSDKTIERPAIRAIRQRAFAGQRIDDIEAAYRDKRMLPGSVEAVAHLLGPSPGSPSPAAMPANSNTRLVGNTAPAEFPPKMPLDTSDVLQGEKGEEGHRQNPDLLLAQADTGTQSDGVPNVETANVRSVDRWRDEWREQGIPPHIPWQLTYPSGSLRPSYAGEEIAISGDPSATKAAEATGRAEAAIRFLPRAKTWPVTGKLDAKGQRTINSRDQSRHQGEGRFGKTRDGGRRNHNGIDIAADLDDPVFSVSDGVVVRVVNSVAGAGNVGFGNEVIIQNDDGTYAQYAHLGQALDSVEKPVPDKHGNNRLVLAIGQRVRAGQQIGSVGRTGNVDALGATPDKQPDTHLHFEIRYGNSGERAKDRTTINPLLYLPPE